MPNTLKLIFAGSPAFATDILAPLLSMASCEVQAVLTQPDRPAGRGKRLQPSSVKQFAIQQGLPLHQPKRLTALTPAEVLTATQPDLLLVAAYGLLLPPAWLAWPKLGAINVHTSLLPRWRGAAPIERALMAGDKQTGTCIMRMTAELDCGDVLASASCDISPQDTPASLTKTLARLSQPLLADVLAACAANGQLPKGHPQKEEGVTYAHKITSADATIDWSKPATEIACQVRALVDRQGASTYCPGGERLAIFAACASAPSPAPIQALPGSILQAGRGKLSVQCGHNSALEILKARFSLGKGTILSAVDLLNGFASYFQAGTCLGDVEALPAYL